MKNFIELLEKLVNDPKKIAIWSEIFLSRYKHGVSAKLLESLLVKNQIISRSHLYSNLKYLENEKIILSNILEGEGEKRKGVYQKHFSINPEFLRGFVGQAETEEKRSESLKGLRLLYLYILESMIQREIRKILFKSKPNVKIDKGNIFGQFMNFKTREEVNYAQNILGDALKRIKDKYPSIVWKKENSQFTVERYLLYLAFLDLFED